MNWSQSRHAVKCDAFFESCRGGCVSRLVVGPAHNREGRFDLNPRSGLVNHPTSGAALLIVRDRLRRRLAQFELITHFLDF
ncbi:MAG: hypothetical protein DME77_02080 [Verrucomicrobia bacterium]|nr:MAG: hypothetical protein DME77_02080 [Verrucomicrobiota bacterium]